MENNKSILKYPLLLIAGIIFIGVLLGYAFETQTEFSALENRYLALRPIVTWQGIADGSFMSEFENYTNEQIPLRNSMVKAKSIAETIIGKCENNGIARGSKGYLFDKATGINPQFEKNVQMIEKFIWDSGMDVVVAVAPTSTQVNASKLPKGMPVLDETYMNDFLSDVLSGCDNAKVVDLFSTFKEYSSEDLYYKTDHHWKSMTAYYAYCDICKELDVTPVDIMQLDMNTADDFYGTFYAKYKGIRVEPDTIEYFDVPIVSYETEEGVFDSLYDTEKLNTYDKYAMFMRGNYGRATVKADNGNADKKLIVFKDSYANCLIPYFVMNYDTIEIVDLRFFGDSVNSFLTENQDADILMLYNYSFINDDKHFFKLLK